VIARTANPIRYGLYDSTNDKLVDTPSAHTIEAIAHGIQKKEAAIALKLL